jgi:hypothetical protein
MRLAIPCLALIFIASLAHAQVATEDLDRGSFIVYVQDRAVGAEVFGIEGRADSLNAAARSYRTIRTKEGEESLEKNMVLTMSRSDFALRFYQATETFRGKKFIKGVLANEADTAFTIFQEQGGGGVADRLAAPPGRMYVLDSGLYSLFNLICMHLHGKTFESRPITLLTLGARDSVVEAQATDLGTETIRWASRPVQARKLRLSDGALTFVAWINPAGKMLRLTHEASGLRVERDAPAVKRPAARPSPGG